MHFSNLITTALTLFVSIQFTMAENAIEKQLSELYSPITLWMRTIDRTNPGVGYRRETLPMGLHICHETKFKDLSIITVSGFVEPKVEFSLMVFKDKHCKESIRTFPRGSFGSMYEKWVYLRPNDDYSAWGSVMVVANMKEASVRNWWRWWRRPAAAFEVAMKETFSFF